MRRNGVMPRKSHSKHRHPHVSLLTGTGLHVLDELPLTDVASTLDARTELAMRLCTLIDAHADIAMPRVIPQTLSLIRRYRLRRLSVDHLMRALVALDQCVEIVVRDRNDGEPAGISVTAQQSGER